MTNDEAIYVLKNTAWLGWDKQKEKVTEAVRMAVEALKTQLPKEDTTSDCISRQEAIRIASGYCHFTNVAKELEKLPSVQPVAKDINVSCKDAISRQAAIDIFDDYNVSVENGELEAYSRDRKRLCDLPSAQPYTDEEIQKMQDMEQAEIEKAFELGQESAKAEIVRCKDCIRYHQPSCLMAYDGKEWSENNGYCHVGERKEDGFR